VSVKVSSWVWHETPEEVKGNRLIALLALADIADDDGFCRFADDTSQAALASKSRMAVSTFREVTDWLEEQGYLESERASQTSRKEYRIILSAGIRRSESGGHTAGSRRSHRQDSAVTAPESGGHSSIDVLDVTDVEDVVPRKRGTRIPQPFVVTPSMVAWARENAPLVDGPRATLRFENYWLSKTGKDASKLDWERTWRNWMLKDQEEAERRGGPRRTTVETGQAASDILAERRALRESQKAVTA
jgi:hypothetical protein